ncbi:hypothetical protein NE237_032591 [Protea cynaroides]|uniref:Uncharacterized protein n=1 Tax=Protea cynaroides TaxID=273540 RepID=A0A9Q0L3N2_9MAGN|nr:hypothetical protein NE237_032591 [Protea cynaroides]
MCEGVDQIDCDWDFLSRHRAQFDFSNSLGWLSSRFDPHGLLDIYPDFHCDGGHRGSHGQNLLQQRTFWQPVALNISYYNNSLLLDDVGNCISCTDESINCSYPQ